MSIERNEIRNEAIRFRKLIQSCDPEATELVIDDFPVMSCKLTSMILVYHFLKLYPDIEIIGVGGARPDNCSITHYWIEIEGMVIDITGDQYNLIDDDELDDFIISFRPYSPIHVAKIESSFLYDLFKVSYVERFTKGFPDISESFVEKLECSYLQLTSLEKCT